MPCCGLPRIKPELCGSLVILGSPKASPQICPWQICKTWRQQGGLLGALLIIGDGGSAFLKENENWDQILLTWAQSKWITVISVKKRLTDFDCLVVWDIAWPHSWRRIWLWRLYWFRTTYCILKYYGQHGACYNLVASVHKGHFRHPTPSRPGHFAKNCRQQFWLRVRRYVLLWLSSLWEAK